MARKLFVAAIDKNTGKTTTCVALLHLASKKYRRIGFLKPFGGQTLNFRGKTVDKDVALMAQVFDLAVDPELMSPVVLYPDTTRKVIRGEITPAMLRDRISMACAELERQCDFIVIEGSGHPGVGSIMGISNARIARLLNAPVLLVTGGGVGNVVDRLSMILALFEKEKVDLRAILVNKVIAAKREQNLELLAQALRDQPFRVLGGFDFQPTLANPTFRRISTLLDLPVQGCKQEMERIIHRVLVGAASTQRMTELITEPTLMLVTSTRDELLVTLSHLYHMPQYHPLIVGLVISGTAPINPITQQILDDSQIPYIRTVNHISAELYKIISRDVANIVPEDREKLDLIKELAEKDLDFDLLEELFSRPVAP